MNTVEIYNAQRQIKLITTDSDGNIIENMINTNGAKNILILKIREDKAEMGLMQQITEEFVHALSDPNDAPIVMTIPDYVSVEHIKI
jgi:hypothetical protein